MRKPLLDDENQEKYENERNKLLDLDACSAQIDKLYVLSNSYLCILFDVRNSLKHAAFEKVGLEINHGIDIQNIQHEVSEKKRLLIDLHKTLSKEANKLREENCGIEIDFHYNYAHYPLQIKDKFKSLDLGLEHQIKIIEKETRQRLRYTFAAMGLSATSLILAPAIVALIYFPVPATLVILALATALAITIGAFSFISVISPPKDIFNIYADPKIHAERMNYVNKKENYLKNLDDMSKYKICLFKALKNCNADKIEDYVKNYSSDDEDSYRDTRQLLPNQAGSWPIWA